MIPRKGLEVLEVYDIEGKSTINDQQSTIINHNPPG